MSLYVTREFLSDLQESNDLRMIRAVLKHTIDEQGRFTTDNRDHRYDGIDDAWIRYAGGGAAYRVIFIRKGPDVYLYRAGAHSIEDALHPPRTLSGNQVAGSLPIPMQSQDTESFVRSSLLKTKEQKFLNRFIGQMYHVRHSEIFIVSPFIDMNLLSGRHRFGAFLDRAVADDTMVSIITSYKPIEELPLFKDLENRGMNTYFIPKLHTKLYVFNVDPTSRSQWQQDITQVAILGSSNFTGPGFALDDEPHANEELCCALEPSLFKEVREYLDRLLTKGPDYRHYEFQLRRKGRC